jgi:hypothetical protein
MAPCGRQDSESSMLTATLIIGVPAYAAMPASGIPQGPIGPAILVTPDG